MLWVVEGVVLGEVVLVGATHLASLEGGDHVLVNAACQLLRRLLVLVVIRAGPSQQFLQFLYIRELHY